MIDKSAYWVAFGLPSYAALFFGLKSSVNNTTKSMKRYSVKNSAIHGRGVFALRAIKPQEVLGLYAGEIITAHRASIRYPDSSSGHTMLVALGKHKGREYVIDGNVGGNSLRFLNHGCNPNCAFERDGKIVRVHALRDIAVGEELLLDYALVVDAKDRKELAKVYKCKCLHKRCRKTMLSPA